MTRHLIVSSNNSTPILDPQTSTNKSPLSMAHPTVPTSSFGAIQIDWQKKIFSSGYEVHPNGIIEEDLTTFDNKVRGPSLNHFLSNTYRKKGQIYYRKSRPRCW
jgi:hypothetical protein